MSRKVNIKEAAKFTIRALPVAGIVFGSILSNGRMQPFYVLATLLWFMVFIIFEVFSVTP